MKYLLILFCFPLFLYSCKSSQEAPPQTEAINHPNIGVGAETPKGAKLYFDGTKAMLDSNWTYWESPRLSAELPIKWAIEFEALKKVLSNCLGRLALSIEHVGSTSVIGLSAKPIIDLDIIIEDDDHILEEVVQQLATLGYPHRGDLGVPGREAFKWLGPEFPKDGSGRFWMKHHLYVCRKGSPSLNNHLNLRNYLRTHPEKVREYSELKKALAQQFPDDIDGYIDGKTEFIVDILEKSGMDISTLHRIEEQN